MASGDARPIPIRAQALRITFPLLDADGDLVTGATPDSEVSKDGGTFTDCSNEATEIATSSGMYYLDLTATEMTADTVAIIVKSGTAKTTPIVLYPVAADGVDFPVNVEAWDGTAIPATHTAGYPICTVKDGSGTGEINTTSGAIDTVTTLTGHTAQTGDSYSRLGAPAGASIAADIAENQTDLDAILDDTGTSGVVIADGAITAAKIGADAITEAKIADDAIAAEHIASGAIVAATFAAGAVDANALAADAVAEIADGVWEEVIETAHETDGTAGEHLNALAKDILARTNTQTLHGLLGIPDSAGINLVDAVWDEDVDTSHQTAGSAGKKLDDAGGAADPWATSLPGAYGAGTAGYIVGNNLDASVADVEADTQDIQTKIGTPANIDTGGATLADNLKKIADDSGGAAFDATTDSLEAIRNNQGTPQTGDVYAALPTNFSDLSITVTTGLVDITQTAADKAWSTAARALTDKAGFSISGTKQTLDALNDISTTQVNTEVDTALSDIGLDHLVSASVTGTDITDDSIIAQLVSKSATADWDDFDNTTDSLQAIRDNQAAGTGLSSLSTGTATAGGNNTITLAGAEPATADWYKDTRIVLTGGTGAGQSRAITAYSTGRVATVDRNWKTNPSTDTTYEIQGAEPSPSVINTEVIDCLDTDTYSEPAQGAPPGSPTIRQMSHYLYKAWRNLTKQSSTLYELYNDAGDTVDHKATCSDAGGVTTVQEVVTGP